MSKAEELARVQVLLDTYADECFSDGKEIGGRVPSDRTLAARKALMDGISRLAGANPPAKIEQAAEPVMIYHGRCTIDCGEHGHQDVEMLKMIPAGSKLYTHPAPQSAQQAAEPVGWMTESEDGNTMLWPTFAEALTYCDEDERPIPLYTHPARKPMTRDDMRKLLAEHFDNEELTGADFFLIRTVERFHDIKE